MRVVVARRGTSNIGVAQTRVSAGDYKSYYDRTMVAYMRGVASRAPRVLCAGTDEIIGPPRKSFSPMDFPIYRETQKKLFPRFLLVPRIPRNKTAPSTSRISPHMFLERAESPAGLNISVCPFADASRDRFKHYFIKAR